MSGVVVASVGDTEGDADLTHSVAGGGVNAGDHLPKFAGVLVPRMTAAFFKISFSTLRREFSRRRANWLTGLPVVRSSCAWALKSAV